MDDREGSWSPFLSIQTRFSSNNSVAYPSSGLTGTCIGWICLHQLLLYLLIPMDNGDGKQGISHEGPLRSIAAPPFAGPVALRNSEPLTPALRDSSSNSGGDTGVTTDQRAPPYQHGAPSSLSQPLTYPRQQPVSVPSAQAVFSNNSAARTTTFEQEPTSRTAAPASTRKPAPASGDPLSDLLHESVQTGRSASTERLDNHDSVIRASPNEFNYRSFPVAQTQAPPLAPEPTLTPASAGGGVVAGGDYGGYRAAAPSPSPSMPALPPPPTNYAGSSYATSAKHYHQQQLPRVMPPLAASRSLPQTTSPTPVQAAYRTPPASPQEKSLDELVSEFLTANAPPAPEPAGQDLSLSDPNGWVAALGYLARRRAWASVVDVAEKMLATYERGGASSLAAEQVMTLRLRRASGMLRMGKIDQAAEAASEAAQGHGQPPLSTVSIAARFVSASAKSMCSGVTEDEAIDELNALKLELESVIDFGAAPPSSSDELEGTTVTAAGAAEWRRRVIASLTNAFVRRGSWRLALGLLETMGEDCAFSAHARDSKARGHNGNASSAAMGIEGTIDRASPEPTEIAGDATVAAVRVDVLTRIGRVFLQFGALEDAEVYFSRAEETAMEPAHDPRILVNNGLLLFSKNDFVASRESFQRAAAAAAQAEASNQDDDEWLWAYLGKGAGLLDCALNNLSLALVYSCDVIGAVQTLEGLIRKDPCLYMLDVVVFNLCTLYDLSFDPVASAKKKRTLQAVAQRFRLEDIDATSFRLS